MIVKRCCGFVKHTKSSQQGLSAVHRLTVTLWERYNISTHCCACDNLSVNILMGYVSQFFFKCVRVWYEIFKKGLFKNQNPVLFLSHTFHLASFQSFETHNLHRGGKSLSISSFDCYLVWWDGLVFDVVKMIVFYLPKKPFKSLKPWIVSSSNSVVENWRSE